MLISLETLQVAGSKSRTDEFVSDWLLSTYKIMYNMLDKKSSSLQSILPLTKPPCVHLSKFAEMFRLIFTPRAVVYTHLGNKVP